PLNTMPATRLTQPSSRSRSPPGQLGSQPRKHPAICAPRAAAEATTGGMCGRLLCPRGCIVMAYHPGQAYCGTLYLRAGPGLVGFQLGINPPGWMENLNCRDFVLPCRLT